MIFHRDRSRRRALSVSLFRSPPARRNTEAAATLAKFDELLNAGERFGTIYADPPWERRSRGLLREPQPPAQAALTVEELASLPVDHLACGSAVAHLWTPLDLYYGAQTVLAAWGFTLQKSLTGIIPKTGRGPLRREADELLLVGTRGGAHFNPSGSSSEPNGQIPTPAEKHGTARAVLERESPAPRLSLFTPDEWEGWTTWPRYESESCRNSQEGDHRTI